MSAITPNLPDTFWDSLATKEDDEAKIRWYMCVIINLSSLNYPDVIPQVYKHLKDHLLHDMTEAQRFNAVQMIREGLIKSTGIAGAARTGNAMRTLSQCVPEEYREKSSGRANETHEFAVERGRQFWTNIYARNPAFDPEASVRASPDYAFVVRDVLYARVFSYDGVIDPLTTGLAMVSALYGMDCPNQLQHHMKGFLFNGGTRDELFALRDLCLGIAKILGVQSRYGESHIPSVGII
ncbi:hypothetical protein V2G26_000024 [Clonostachys chloroleuca]